jgi:hypothetical protein
MLLFKFVVLRMLASPSKLVSIGLLPSLPTSYSKENPWKNDYGNKGNNQHSYLWTYAISVASLL